MRSATTHQRYGYQTHTQLTFLLFLDQSARGVSDTNVQTVFRALHHIYGLYTSNPFAAIQPGDLLPSKPKDTETLPPSLPPNVEPSREPISSDLFHKRLSELCGWTVHQAAV